MPAALHVYRRYDFAPARGQTMFFGSLVHRTVEDLHQWLLAQAEAGRTVHEWHRKPPEQRHRYGCRSRRPSSANSSSATTTFFDRRVGTFSPKARGDKLWSSHCSTGASSEPLRRSVTETEVKLALPGLTTPRGRPFLLEGVVDIVRDGDEVRMYDLKTHDDREVRAERELYEDQLNVYAHIWKGFRGQSLHGTAIIATRLPPALREALRVRDPQAINAAMASWNPVVDLRFDENEVARTVEDFGRCVDAIEDGEFAPLPADKLEEQRGTRRWKDHGDALGVGAERVPTFAEIHCRNCDARFSCTSYDTYLKRQGKSSRKRWTPTERDEETELELDAWIEENVGED